MRSRGRLREEVEEREGKMRRKRRETESNRGLTV